MKFLSNPIVFVIILLCITAFKIWLSQAQMLQLGGTSIFDDFLYVKEAATIAKGAWLGSYDQYTLIKGSFYPMWIAGMHFLHIPLLISQQAMYIFACLCIYFALKKYYSVGFSLITYTLLLFNPIMNIVNEWVCRYHLYTSLTLIIVVIVLILPKTHTYWKIIRNYVCLGMCVAAFYLMREEFAWIIPFLFVTVLYFLAKNAPTPYKKIHTYGLMICIVTALILIAAVAYSNYRVYGKFVLNELKQTAFHQVYGDLLRVTHVSVPWVIVPNDVIRKVGEVSPHFAPIAAHVLGPKSQWARNVSALYMGHTTDEITGSQLIFVLRNAAFDVGYLSSATDANRHFSVIHKEIQQACSDGRLDCSPVLFGFFPPLHQTELYGIGVSFVAHMKRLTTIQEVNIGLGYSELPNNELMRKMTRPVITTEFLPLPDGPFYYETTNTHIRYVRAVILLYRYIGSLFLCVGGVAFLLFIGSSVYRRSYTFITVFLIALGGSVITLVLLMSYIDAVQFPIETAHYLSPVYPLLLLMSCISIYELWLGRMKKKK